MTGLFIIFQLIIIEKPKLHLILGKKYFKNLEIKNLHENSITFNKKIYIVKPVSILVDNWNLNSYTVMNK